MDITGTAYEVIAKVNGLVKLRERCYIDKNGNHLYLDRYGFHSNIVLSNNELIAERAILLDLIKKLDAPENLKYIVKDIILNSGYGDKKDLKKLLKQLKY